MISIVFKRPGHLEKWGVTEEWIRAPIRRGRLRHPKSAVDALSLKQRPRIWRLPRVSGLVIQVLRYRKQENVDDKIINILKRKLSVENKEQLVSDIRYAPAWIGEILKRLSL